jgi:hypothetical protein
MESDEVQAGLVGHDPAPLRRLTVLVENGKVDPRESRIESGAPDDVLDVEDPPVLQHRPAVLDAFRARNPLHPGRCQVGVLHPDEWPTLGHDGRARLPAQRRAHREDTVEHNPEHEGHQQPPNE